jgi:hypothetical protein
MELFCKFIVLRFNFLDISLSRNIKQLIEAFLRLPCQIRRGEATVADSYQREILLQSRSDAVEVI